MVALALPLIPLGAGMQKITAYGFIYIGWANTAFYWFGMFATNRALTFGDNPIGEANLASFLGFFPAFVMAFVTIIAMLMLARFAFSTRSES